MNINIQSIRGMHDYLPEEVHILNKIEITFKKILFNYSYSEIRLPILEKTELFKRSIGKITDVIEKEMYSFLDKKGNSISLRPESTVGCVRSMIQNKLIYHKNQRLWYYGPMFRYERPQKGRYRQFYQLGIEVFGIPEPDIELELILMINKLWNSLGISNLLILEINLIGSIESRLRYKQVLKKFLINHKSYLDKDCLRRLNTNPLRILDSKNKEIQKLLLDAPLLIDYVDENSRSNFEKLCNFMNFFKISYVINNRLIRGLDYYNNTVFEWKSSFLGSQNTVCAGGRYDTLVQQLGGLKTPAIGLAIGIDRLFLLIQSLFKKKNSVFMTDVRIFFSSEKIKLQALRLSEEIRYNFPNIKVLLEFNFFNLKKILKNIKKYPSNIILFLEEQIIKKEIIFLYDCKNSIKKNISIFEVVKIINLILNKSLK